MDIDTGEIGTATIIDKVNEIKEQDKKIGRKKRAYVFMPKGNKFNQARSFSCDTCNASFVNNANLIRHHQVHSDERPFGCVYCDKVILNIIEQKKSLAFKSRFLI